MKSNKIYIILFIILYTFVALVSGIHGFAFFGLANTSLLAIMLAIAFEIGQAAVLFSILTDSSQRKKVMPWVLMSILTLVQIMGNVYNSYKYLISNASENLRFFKEPIFVWTQLPDAEANVILSYIQGAILPIVALLLTAMVSGFLAKKENEEVEYIEKTEEEPLEGEEVGDIEEDEPSEEALKKFEEIEKEREEKSNSIPEDEDYKEEEEQKIEEPKEEPKEEYIAPEVTVSEIPEQINDKTENIQEDKEKSHFINL